MTDPSWVRRFHAGERRVLEEIYQEYFSVVMNAVRPLLSELDAENVVHDVFVRILSFEQTRRSFHEGSFSAWITTVAKNLARDKLRKDKSASAAVDRMALESVPAPPDDPPDVEASRIVKDFIEHELPAKWKSVFEARFLKQLSQREAARHLGIRRTTLAYQEMRVRSLLHRFVLSRGKR